MSTVNWQRLQSAKLRQGETWFRSAYLPPDNIYLMLCYGTLSTTSTNQQILDAELASSNGYSRQLFTFDAGSISNGNALFFTDAPTITASGLSLQYNTAIAWATNLTEEWPEFIAVFPGTEIILDGRSHTFQLSWEIA